MAFGTPYLIGTNTPASATSEPIAVTGATTLGDAILVVLGNTSAAGATVTGISDDGTGGGAANSYARVGTAVASHQFGDVWICYSTRALTTSNTITVTWSATSGTKNCMAVGVSGVASSAAVDQDVTSNQGSGTSPTVTSGTLSQATELAIGVINNASAGGAPSGLGSFTQAAQLHTGANAYTTVAYLDTASTTAVTWSATIVTATACMILITLLPAAGGAAPSGSVQPRAAAVVARRAPARAVQSRITGPANAHGGGGTVQPRATVAVPRRTAARAAWARVTGTANAHGPSGAVQPRASVPVPRRAAARALWLRVTGPANAHGPSGTVQPRAAVPVPRRTAARAVWARITGPANAQPQPQAAPAQPRPAIPRRAPARGLWRGLAAPFRRAAPVSGELAPARPNPARAVWRGTRVTTVNAVPVAVPPPRAPRPVPRRYPARGWWRGRIAAGSAPPAALAEPGTITITDLLAGNVAVADLLAGQVTVTDLLAGNVAVADLLAGGVRITDLLAGAITVTGP